MSEYAGADLSRPADLDEVASGRHPQYDAVIHQAAARDAVVGDHESSEHAELDIAEVGHVCDLQPRVRCATVRTVQCMYLLLHDRRSFE